MTSSLPTAGVLRRGLLVSPRPAARRCSRQAIGAVIVLGIPVHDRACGDVSAAMAEACWARSVCWLRIGAPLDWWLIGLEGK